MAHKTLIDGTAYEIDGGKAMVDGTVYEIDHGTTLVDGTAYEVGVAKMVTVKLIASGSKNGYAWTIIDGVRYEGTEEVAVPIGTVITCYAKISTSIVGKWYEPPCFISVNGTLMVGTENYTTISYAFTVNTDTVISMLTKTGDTDDRGTVYDCGSIAITETPEGQVAVILNCVQSFGAFNGGVNTMTINGIATKPTTEQAAYAVNVGDNIVFATPLTITPVVVTLNGELVQSATPVTRTYTYSVKSNVVIDALMSSVLMLYITEET